MPELDDPGAVLRRSALAEIDPRTLYLLTKLRQDVFSLEQRATEPDLDGRDLDPTTILLWIETPGPDADAAGLEREPVAHARVLTAGGTVRIGRAAGRATERGDGYGRRIMRAAVDLGTERDPRAEGTVRIGRVAVRATERGAGYGRRIMRAALDLAAELDPRAEVHLDAQAHLEPWYASMGFETVSDVFLEAGIEHVAMMFRQPIR